MRLGDDCLDRAQLTAVSEPNAPAFPCTAPPTVPGTVAIHSRPMIPLRAATAATWVSGVPDAASSTLPRTSTSLQLFSSTTPRIPASATRRFVPPPRMNAGRTITG